MRREGNIPTLVSICAVFAVGACAEGTKLDVAGSGGSGGALSSAVTTGGKLNATTSGGSANGARGGAVVGTGGTIKSSAPTGGTASGSSATASTATSLSGGGAANGSGGQSSVGVGATLSDAGAPSSQGGTTAATTIAPPSNGLGIKITSQVAGTDAVRTTFQLTNQGTATVDLATVKIRYYFTMDSWTTPVLVVDTAAIHQGDAYIDARTIQSQFYPLSLPNADRYVEMSYGSSASSGLVLKSGGYLEVQSRLYDQAYKAPNVSNDYSFVGAVGYTDKITVYVGGQLAWGTEPGSSNVGAGGSGGGPSGGVSGAMGTVGGNANGSGGTLSSGNPGGTASIGAAGDTAAVSYAGTTNTDSQPGDAGSAGTAGTDGTAGML